MSEASDELRGLDLYFDCASGIAGDMTLGALLDLGVPEEVVRGELAKLPIEFRMERERVKRGALVGTHIKVIDSHHHDDEDHQHSHRHYREIRAMLEKLDPAVANRARAIFDRIAVVEARLHGVTV